MNLDEARELAHKLNHADDKAGVGRGVSITGWETKLEAIENPDGELLDVTIEQSKHYWHPLGHVGPASPCCEAPGDEHDEDCAMRGRDDTHPWNDDAEDV